MKQKIIYAVLIFLLVLSIVIIGREVMNADYYDKIGQIDNLIQYASSPVEDEGFIMEISNFLKITDFVNFVNGLPQRLDFMGIMYIISIAFLLLRLYFQRLFNKYNITVRFPVVSTFCLVVYVGISFTFTNKINLFEVVLIYAIVMLCIELIKLIWENDKAHDIKKVDYNVLDMNNKPLYFTAMTRKKFRVWDMVISGFIFITIKGIVTLPIIYVVFATIPYLIYAYFQIQKAKNFLSVSNVT